MSRLVNRAILQRNGILIELFFENCENRSSGYSTLRALKYFLQEYEKKVRRKLSKTILFELFILISDIANQVLLCVKMPMQKFPDFLFL